MHLALTSPCLTCRCALTDHLWTSAVPAFGLAALRSSSSLTAASPEATDGSLPPKEQPSPNGHVHGRRALHHPLHTQLSPSGPDRHTEACALTWTSHCPVPHVMYELYTLNLISYDSYDSCCATDGVITVCSLPIRSLIAGNLPGSMCHVSGMT